VIKGIKAVSLYVT